MKKSKISADDARALVASALSHAGISTRDAHTTAAHLVAAEERGYSGHGLRRVPGIASIAGQLSENSTNLVSPTTSGFLSVNGQNRLGIPSVADALDEASAGLRDAAAIIVGLTGYRGTTGSLGVFGTALAERGIASMLMCSSEYAVAPHGSRRAVIGTNPIAITFPGSPTTFCADMATSAWSYGSIRDAADAKKRIPKGIVQTAGGKSSTDPNDADNGSQLPMAGHKGYALGLAVELLCGPLLGGKAGRDAVKGSDGFFAVLINANAARDAADVNRDAHALYDEILAGPPSDPAIPIRIPGRASAERRSHNNEILVSADLLDKIRAIGST